MKQPFWKILTSYLYEVPIESIASEVNGEMHVLLRRGRYQLCTENAIYSFADLYGNFVKCFQRLQLDGLGGDRVLILGFGLGSIPVILEKKFDRRYHFTAIEKDEVVIHLANKYVLPGIKSPIEMISANAMAFVHQTTERFDLICVDIYLDDVVPEEFETIQFLYQLEVLLRPQGLIISNKLSRKPEDLVQTRTFFEQTFKHVFPDAVHLDVDGNWMLLNHGRLLL